MIGRRHIGVGAAFLLPPGMAGLVAPRWKSPAYPVVRTVVTDLEAAASA
jgi:hypothetical protein